MAIHEHVGSVNLHYDASPAADGYRHLTDALWWRMSLLPCGATDEQWRLISSAARRCDGAHRQLERLRNAITFGSTMDQSSSSFRRLVHDVIGDAEMAFTAMHAAIRLAEVARDRFAFTVPFPAPVAAKAAAVKALRDAYEHIDERAAGWARRRQDPDALTLFEFATLFQQRKIVYGTASLEIDAEASEILVELRTYLWSVWLELCV